MMRARFRTALLLCACAALAVSAFGEKYSDGGGPGNASADESPSGISMDAVINEMFELDKGGEPDVSGRPKEPLCDKGPVRELGRLTLGSRMRSPRHKSSGPMTGGRIIRPSGDAHYPYAIWNKCPCPSVKARADWPNTGDVMCLRRINGMIAVPTGKGAFRGRGWYLYPDCPEGTRPRIRNWTAGRRLTCGSPDLEKDLRPERKYYQLRLIGPRKSR